MCKKKKISLIFVDRLTQSMLKSSAKRTLSPKSSLADFDNPTTNIDKKLTTGAMNSSALAFGF